MTSIAMAVTILVALEHLGFMVLETFLWTRPAGRRIFGLSADFAARTRALAANQGIYNGFLAAGLIWGLVRPDEGVVNFFLLCVIVAGVAGAVTVKRSILFVQAVPAAIGLMLNFVR